MDYSQATISKAGLVRKEVTPRRDLNEKDPDMQCLGEELALKPSIYLKA